MQYVAAYNLITDSVVDSLLSSDLEKIKTTFPKHLIVLAGWHPTVETRQLHEDEPAIVGSDSSVVDDVPVLPSDAPVAAKAAPTDGGILKRYQLLTPGLIISLLLALFVLVPVVLLGISALAGIQSPVRLDPPKGFQAGEKKNQ